LFDYDYPLPEIEIEIHNPSTKSPLPRNHRATIELEENSEAPHLTIAEDNTGKQFSATKYLGFQILHNRTQIPLLVNEFKHYQPPELSLMTGASGRAPDSF